MTVVMMKEVLIVAIAQMRRRPRWFALITKALTTAVFDMTQESRI